MEVGGDNVDIDDIDETLSVSESLQCPTLIGFEGRFCLQTLPHCLIIIIGIKIIIMIHYH